MNFYWAAIVPALITGIVGMFPVSFQPTVRSFLESIFGQAGKDQGTPDVIHLLGPAAAPDEIKSAVKQLVASFVQKYLVNRPILLKIALSFVNNMPDSFVDGIWDSIFKPQIAAGTMPASSPWAGKTKAEKPLPEATSEQCQSVAAEIGYSS